MGYDASVYLIYGIKIHIDDRDEEHDEIFDIIERLKPGYIDYHHLRDHDDNDAIKYIYGELDMKPTENGYYCFTVGDDFFVACYVHEHITARNEDDCLEVVLPEETLKSEFHEWVTKNNINHTPKLCTKLYVSY